MDRKASTGVGASGQSTPAPSSCWIFPGFPASCRSVRGVHRSPAESEGESGKGGGGGGNGIAVIIVNRTTWDARQTARCVRRYDTHCTEIHTVCMFLHVRCMYVCSGHRPSLREKAGRCIRNRFSRRATARGAWRVGVSQARIMASCLSSLCGGPRASRRRRFACDGVHGDRRRGRSHRASFPASRSYGGDAACYCRQEI